MLAERPSGAGPAVSGAEPAETTCPDCNGSGEVMVMTWGQGPDDHEESRSCKTCDGTGTVAERLSGASPEAVEALRELVACKDLKDQALADYTSAGIGTSIYHKRISEYERRKSLAWEAARAALASQPAAEPRDAILARMVVLAPYTSFLGAYENEWRELIASAAEPPSTQPYLSPDAGFPFPVTRRAETDLEAIGREYSVDLTGQPEDGILFVDGGTKRNE